MATEMKNPSEVSDTSEQSIEPWAIQHCIDMRDYHHYRMMVTAKELRNFSRKRKPDPEDTEPINDYRDEYRNEKALVDFYNEMLDQLLSLH